MPTAAGSASRTGRAQAVGSDMGPMMQAVPEIPDVLTKDTIISWFRGEFAAANAIIDALCGHLAELQGGGRSDYEAAFTAIHRRRLNWIPVLQMQKYHSIADVAEELKKVADKNTVRGDRLEKEDVKRGGCLDDEKEKVAQKIMENGGNGEVGGEEVEDSPDSDTTDSGSQEVQHVEENIDICSNHDKCDGRTSQIKLTKGFSAKEHIKGHMVNIVKGLKLYEEVFTDLELARLSEFVSELRSAGHNGELSGETFILFNKQIKGNKRELIQLGVPIFGHVREDANSTIGIEPIPAVLQGVIKHLIQWQLIPEYKKPNGCIINFFDEGEYSQPFLKPPHLDQPVSSLLLSESTMAFGRTLVSDSEGNYRGALKLSLKEGSLLVMRGNSSDMARHVMCSSPSKRVSITFFRVRPDTNQVHSQPTAPQAGPMTLWQPSVPVPCEMSNGALNGYEAVDMMPKLGVLQSPVVMLTPVTPMVMSPKKLPRDGTGVFLPWIIRSQKLTKHLPPRVQKGNMLALPPVETDIAQSTSDQR
ncbi:Oxidoreductase [Hibiscus syriacus]|uniref:Oxidoreductase n=1 Tax=Hibiscus syriacus TaxID=106335 RepID=A0A6A2ZS74_HIBSY|nr:RNA demethylase ALKBH10B-like [Hibiscus syriacus]KAE8693765.1 Oxidoreductase [Hibiscus syriacus]